MDYIQTKRHFSYQIVSESQSYESEELCSKLDFTGLFEIILLRYENSLSILWTQLSPQNLGQNSNFTNSVLFSCFFLVAALPLANLCDRILQSTRKIIRTSFWVACYHANIKKLISWRRLKIDTVSTQSCSVVLDC